MVEHYPDRPFHQWDTKPLGIKTSLLPSPPLGHTGQQRGFLEPLGSRSLTSFDIEAVVSQMPAVPAVPAQTNPTPEEIPAIATLGERLGQQQPLGAPEAESERYVSSPLPLAIAPEPGLAEWVAEAQPIPFLTVATGGAIQPSGGAAIDLPSELSSIAELLGESSSVADEYAFTPFGLQRIEPPVDSHSSRAIDYPVESHSQFPSREVTLSAPGYEEIEDDSENLEILARKVYERIKDRLEIERERSGRRSGRLPW